MSHSSSELRNSVFRCNIITNGLWILRSGHACNDSTHDKLEYYFVVVVAESCFWSVVSDGSKFSSKQRDKILVNLAWSFHHRRGVRARREATRRGGIVLSGWFLVLPLRFQEQKWCEKTCVKAKSMIYRSLWYFLVLMHHNGKSCILKT